MTEPDLADMWRIKNIIIAFLSRPAYNITYHRVPDRGRTAAIDIPVLQIAENEIKK